MKHWAMVTLSSCTNYGQNLVGGLDSFLQIAVFYKILSQGMQSSNAQGSFSHLESTKIR